MAGILSAGFALAGILFGGSGNVSIGSFTAVGLETPEQLPFGGHQRTVVHKFPGGARVIDVMGPDEEDIRWSGYFSGPNAQQRAQQLDAMRKQGIAVPLTWPGDGRTVIITDFRCRYANGGFMLPYEICCIVVPGLNPRQAPTLLQSLGADVLNGLGITDALGTLTPALQSAQTALQTVQAVLPVGAALTGGSAAFLSVQTAVNGAGGIIGGALTTANGNMLGVMQTATAAGNVIGGSSGASGVSALSAAATAAQNLAGISAVGGFVGRMAANLRDASN